jgi:Calcineurin-like phosphoesterase
MTRTYVIGDVHGCYREFERLLDPCSDHAYGRPARLITSGDYVDRGPDSFGVVFVHGRRVGPWRTFACDLPVGSIRVDLTAAGQ